MASEKQEALVQKLLAERAVPIAIADLARTQLDNPDLTPGQFSKTGIIDVLFGLPKKAGTEEPKVLPQIGEGLYLVNETVFEVIVSNKSGKPYAKRLDPVNGKFVYAPGAIFDFPAGVEAITIQQALAFGLKHGVCIKGHPLSSPLSIQLGIGPTCCENIFGMTQTQLLKQQETLAAA